MGKKKEIETKIANHAVRTIRTGGGQKKQFSVNFHLNANRGSAYPDKGCWLLLLLATTLLMFSVARYRVGMGARWFVFVAANR